MYAVAGGTPLADYAPVRAALKAVALCRGPVSFESFSAALRAPELHADAVDAAGAWRAWISSCASRAAARCRSRTGSGWGGASGADSAGMATLARLERLQAGADSGPTRGLPSRWVEHWLALFEAVPWGYKERWSSREYQAAERFRELLARFACTDQSLGTLSCESAEALLAGAARDTAFQPETGIAPIWITGRLSDPWLSYSGIWIAGLAEQRWPARAQPVPLLPIALQIRHGIEAASAAAQLAAAGELQNRWRMRTGELVFSCAGGADTAP